jgi:signal transduction histidine kinase
MKLLARRAPAVEPTVPDVALAAGACLLDLLIFSDVLQGDHASDGGFPVAVVVAYAAVGYAPLIWRRRAPVIVFTILLVHSLITTQMPRYAATLGLVVALYTVAARRSAITASLTLLATAVPLGLAVQNQVASAEVDARVSTFVGSAVVLGSLYVTAWGAGRLIAANGRRTAELERRRHVEAREAVDAERTRIARELHDIIAHSVTVMTMQAGGARRIMTSDLDRAGQALAQIEECGTQATEELARMLRVLRLGETDSGLVPERHPELAEVDGLLASVRQVGVSVGMEVSGQPGHVDPSVSHTAYRIIQEGLTNVTKHAGPGTRAAIVIRWADDLVIEVRDDGGGHPYHGAPALSTGHGLLGLRERVSVVGGRLDAGPGADGGFRLVATLPVSAIGSEPGLTDAVGQSAAGPAMTGRTG